MDVGRVSAQNVGCTTITLDAPSRTTRFNDMGTMICSWPGCDHTHKGGFRLFRLGTEWRCVEHLPAAKRGVDLRRPLTDREARADAAERNK